MIIGEMNQLGRKITKTRAVVSTLLILGILFCGITGILMDSGHKGQRGADNLPGNFERGKEPESGISGVKEIHKVSGYILFALVVVHFGINCKMYFCEIKGN